MRFWLQAHSVLASVWAWGCFYGCDLDIGLTPGFHAVPVDHLTGDLHALVLEILKLLGLMGIIYFNRADGFAVDDGFGIDLHRPTSGLCPDRHRAMERPYQGHLLRIALVSM